MFFSIALQNQEIEFLREMQKIIDNIPKLKKLN
jgi:hypothetical protein